MLDQWLEAPADTDFWTAEAPRGSTKGLCIRSSRARDEIRAFEIVEA